MREPYVVTLGTAGGPKLWTDAPERTGIATAVVVGEKFYLVDAGYGAGRQIQRAGLDFKDLEGVFITHLHSDHTVDLPALMIFGLYQFLDRVDRPIPVIGPGERGKLPEVSPHAKTPPVPAAPQRPTPGIAGMMENIVGAFATDLNDRILDSLRPNPLQLLEPRDIRLPEGIGFDPNRNATPEMEPFTVFEDERVTVTAILVEHPPVAPAYAFRFDTDGGSVTISGDTCETANMIRLARGTDLLLHEAIDFDWVEESYRGKTDEGSKASRQHHYKSHTSVAGACRIAEAAGARQLALHHLVPGAADGSVWAAGREGFSGRFHVPDDLEVIGFGAASGHAAAAAPAAEPTAPRRAAHVVRLP